MRGLRYLEQVQICDALIRQHRIQIPEAADLLDRAGTYLCKCALPSIAEPLFRRALCIQEQRVVSEPALVGMSFGEFAMIYSGGQTGQKQVESWPLQDSIR